MRLTFISIFILLAMTMISAQQPSVHYTLGMPNPSTHLLEVEVSIGNLPGDLKELDFILPVWRPGRYMVMDFASGIQEVSAVDGDGKQLAWSKIEKSVWRVMTGAGREVTLRYKVYANEFGLRTRGLNDEHAFVDGSAVFMFARLASMSAMPKSAPTHTAMNVTLTAVG